MLGFLNILNKPKTSNDNFGDNKDVCISVTKEDFYTILEIKNEFGFEDCNEEIRESNEYKYLDKVESRLVFDKEKRKFRKGTYYIFDFNGYSYTILITNTKVMINEIAKNRYDEERCLENIIEEKILDFTILGMEYSFTKYKHESNFSTYYHMFYDNFRESIIPEFEFSKNDAYAEIKELVDNLSCVEWLPDFLDRTLLEGILLDLKPTAQIRVKE